MHSESLISPTLDVGSRADMMLFGVSTVSTSTTLFEGNFLDTHMLDELVALGAVGAIGGRFFDAAGTPVDTDLRQRAVPVQFRRHPGLREGDPYFQRRRQAPRHSGCASRLVGQAAGL